MAAKQIMLRSGLVALVKSVRAYLSENSVGAEVRLGFRQRAQQVNQGDGRANRVVFMPCEETGKGGKLQQPKQTGWRPIFDENKVRVADVRALRTWERLVTVCIWAVDSADAGGTDEDAQIEATDALFEWVMRAVHHATATDTDGDEKSIGAANIVWGDPKWELTPVENSFGRELRVPLTYWQPIYDKPAEVAYPSAKKLGKDLVDKVAS